MPHTQTFVELLRSSLYVRSQLTMAMVMEACLLRSSLYVRSQLMMTMVMEVCLLRSSLYIRSPVYQQFSYSITSVSWHACCIMM